MVKRPQPAPGAIYECDRLDDPMFLAIRLYTNRLELDRGTTYLHRYKKTEAYKVSDLNFFSDRRYANRRLGNKF